MERSVTSRLMTLFQQLEKCGGKAARNQIGGDELQQSRYVTSKIYQILNTQEKIHRDGVLKNNAQVDLLLATMKNSSDRTVVLNILHILQELIGKTLGKRAGVLVTANATSVVLQAVVREFEEEVTCDELLLLSHQVLVKLAQKDRKFALKARLNRALPITLTLIKNSSSNFKQLQTYLQVFKHYTSNSVNASYLGKHNSIPSIFRVIQQCGRKHTTVLKLALDILNNLTKSRNNAARTIGGDHVPHLLGLYHEWHQIDPKHKHISIRKGLLNIIKNITNLRSGRKALVDANGIQILYDSAQEVIDCREMESLILLASVIMRKCCPRNKLPLGDITSAIKWELPDSDLYPENSRQDAASLSFGGFTESQDSDNSSLDDDDDIDSDDERFKTDNSEEIEEDQGMAPEPFKRSADDLRMYDGFFPELFELQEEEEEEAQPPTSIYIPTGTFEGNPHNQTLPSGMGDREVLYNNHPAMFRMPTTLSYSSSKSSGYSSLHYDASDYVDSYGMERCDSATAINLKTGTSVFSLDISAPTQAAKSALKKQSVVPKSSAVNKKSKTNKKGQKEVRKMKKLSTGSISSTAGASSTEIETEFANSLCITPVPTAMRDPMDDIDRLISSSSEEEELDVCHDSIVFQDLANQTKSVYRFEKLAYPDLVGAKAVQNSEGLYHRKFGVQRVKVYEDIDRMIHPENVIDRDVYDVDAVVQRAGASYTGSNSNLANRDPLRIGARLESMVSSSLRFNAQFESGNLRKAIWVREFEYDLILNPDINTNHHHQWFYFEVSNMVADVPYRFNIINCEKLNSQFNFGMKPVMFSVAEALEGRPYWTRVGTDICYYKNHFTRSQLATGGVKGKTYYTSTFNVRFKHSKDVCYLAYHYPYTYTTLQTHLHMLERQCDHSQVFFRKQDLCTTLTANTVPVVTITAQPKSYSHEHIEELKSRPYIFLSGRVHPGESNSSWVMKGTLDFLLSKKSSAQLLRETYIFKVVPMLNPDGVINGNHRCSVAAEDLNRRWDNPCPRLHPTIYHTKGLLQYMQMISKTPMVYCDYHGHSRRKNIFLYGCSPAMSWIPNDNRNPACTGNRTEDNAYKSLPRILHMTASAFSWQNCSFVVEKAKETTARVVVWRQIGVIRSYTMESSYCGIDKDGKYKDQHISTAILEDMGQKFCEALLRIRSRFVPSDIATLPSPLGQQDLGAAARSGGDEDINLDDDDNLGTYCGGGDVDDMNEESSDDEDLSQEEEDDNCYEENQN